MRVAKTLIIGVGTAGQNICEGVANCLNSKYGDYKKASWMGIKVLETAHKSDVLDEDDFIGMFVEPSAFADYVSGAPHVGIEFGWNEWGDPNLLKNLGAYINDGAGNIRMAGRLALFHNYNLISGKITVEIQRLQKLSPAEIQKNLGTKDNIDVMQGFVNVYVVGSLCGGTGSGCCADLGYLLRIWGNNDVNTTAIFTLPHWSLQNPRLKKNAFVALTELNHYMLSDSVWSQKLSGFSSPATDGRKPYDLIYLTQPINCMPNEIDKNESTIASFLTAVCTEISHDIIAANVDGMNVLARDRQLGYLSPSFSTFGIASLEYPAEHVSRMCKDRFLQKIYGCWKDNPTKYISQFRAELFEKTPKFIVDKFYDKSIITKYEARMKEEFEKQKFTKDDSIHEQIDVIFSTIKEEINNDVYIKERADFWLDNFLTSLEKRFLEMADRYITSINAGPGFLSRILRLGKTDIDSWIEPNGKIKKLCSKAVKVSKLKRENIRNQTEDYLHIDGLPLFIDNKQNDAWKSIIANSVSYVKDMVHLVATKKIEKFIDPKVDDNYNLLNIYNFFADKYIERLENFESAIVAMHKHHEDIYNKYLESVPQVNGIQFYKNNSIKDEVEEIYNMVMEDSNENPDISLEQREFDMASSVIEKLKDDLISKLTDSMSSFDSRLMSDIKEYIPDYIKKTIELRANSYFADLSKYRNILYLINKEGDASAAISSIQQNSEPTMISSQSPIPEKFRNDPAICNINVQKYRYAFCPKQESRLFRKDYIDDIIGLLCNVQLSKPVFDSRDLYRIITLQMEHGFSLAHIAGIMKSNDSDYKVLEDSMSCNDFSFWNTRKDVKWKNCLISKDEIDRIKQFWVVYRLLGNYRDENNSPWYKISNGKVFLDIVSDNVVVKTEKVGLSLDDAIMDIALNPSRQRAIELTCQNKIQTYIQQVGKHRFIEILFKCLDNWESYELNISKKEAENCIINYCFNNGLESEFIEFKFPVDKPVDEKLFSQLLYWEGEEVAHYECFKTGYYCPNGHKLGNGEDIQSTLRNMIANRFVCPFCDKRYWP